MSLLAEENRCERESMQIGGYLVVIARVPIAGLAIGQVALVAANAADKPRDHLLARYARQQCLGR
jgi:hypothetical protein